MSLRMPINLIPKARQGKAERRRRLHFWFGAWCAYAAVLALCAGLMYLRLGTSRDLSSELDQQDQQIASLQTDSHQTNAQLLQVSQKLLSAKGLLEQPDWSQLLSVLAGLRNSDVVLEDIELKLTAEQLPPVAAKKPNDKPIVVIPKTKWNLHLNGHGKTPESVSQYVLRLERTDLFDMVNLERTERDPIGAGEATSFSIQCPLKGRGRAWQ
jgi:hypothetical protein